MVEGGLDAVGKERGVVDAADFWNGVADFGILEFVGSGENDGDLVGDFDAHTDAGLTHRALIGTVDDVVDGFRNGGKIPFESPSEVYKGSRGHAGLHHIDAEVQVERYECRVVPKIDAGTDTHIEKVVELVCQQLVDLDVEIVVFNCFQNLVFCQSGRHNEVVAVVVCQCDIPNTSGITEGGHKYELMFLQLSVAWILGENRAGK